MSRARVFRETRRSSRVVTAVLGMMFLGAATVTHAFTVVLTQSQLADEVKAYFPIEYETAGVRTQLDMHGLRLLQDKNRVAVNLTLTSAIPGVGRVSGTTEISGEIDYHSGRREFYLRDPTLLSLKLADVSPDYAAVVEEGVQALILHAWPVIIVYRLSEEQVKGSLSLRLLKTVQVRDGKVLLEMGF
jgi:hypothetical protein